MMGVVVSKFGSIAKREAGTLQEVYDDRFGFFVFQNRVSGMAA